jgi:hypothetical protein
MQFLFEILIEVICQTVVDGLIERVARTIYSGRCKGRRRHRRHSPGTR